MVFKGGGWRSKRASQIGLKGKYFGLMWLSRSCHEAIQFSKRVHMMVGVCGASAARISKCAGGNLVLPGSMRQQQALRTPPCAHDRPDQACDDGLPRITHQHIK